MAKIKGIFFDQDGVIIDTELDGHRVAFNQAFREAGYDVEWDVATYRHLLNVAGGKERMKYYLHNEGFGVDVPPEEEDQLIRTLHERKTDIFLELLETGNLPLRPGIRRFMGEAKDAGLTIGVCTTASRRSATAIAEEILHDIDLDFVLAGDMVSRKKPDPEIYLAALERSGLTPDEAIVIEDSRPGIAAAKAAGMRVIATASAYTLQEDLSAADVVITALGDPEGQHGQLILGDRGLGYNGVLYVQQVIDFFSTP